MNFLFYDDSPVFGGHEVMTLLGVEALLQHPEHQVKFLATEKNTTLLEKLRALKSRFPALEIQPVAERSSKLEALKNLISPGRGACLAHRLKTSQPDLVIAVQGNIEHSSLVMLAARRAKVKDKII